MRILHHVSVFSNGVNGFLKSERATKMYHCSSQPVSVPTLQTVTTIKKIVRRDRRMSIRMMAKTVNTVKETIRKILHDKLNL